MNLYIYLIYTGGGGATGKCVWAGETQSWLAHGIGDVRSFNFCTRGTAIRSLLAEMLQGEKGAKMVFFAPRKLVVAGSSARPPWMKGCSRPMRLHCNSCSGHALLSERDSGRCAFRVRGGGIWVRRQEGALCGSLAHTGMTLDAQRGWGSEDVRQTSPQHGNCKVRIRVQWICATNLGREAASPALQPPPARTRAPILYARSNLQREGASCAPIPSSPASKDFTQPPPPALNLHRRGGTAASRPNLAPSALYMVWAPWAQLLRAAAAPSGRGGLGSPAPQTGAAGEGSPARRGAAGSRRFSRFWSGLCPGM